MEEKDSEWTLLNQGSWRISVPRFWTLHGPGIAVDNRRNLAAAANRTTLHIFRNQMQQTTNGTYYKCRQMRFCFFVLSCEKRIFNERNVCEGIYSARSFLSPLFVSERWNILKHGSCCCCRCCPVRLGAARGGEITRGDSARKRFGQGCT